MKPSSIKSRIASAAGKRLLLELLLQQQMIQGNRQIARSFATCCDVVEYGPGRVVIRQGASDNDIYFLLSGTVRVLINEREVAVRSAGQHVGEMALVDPSSKRTASVIACERAVFARVSEGCFVRVANSHPHLWRSIAIALVHRLDERRKFHRSPNAIPGIFIGSSTEGLPLARTLRTQIPADVAAVTLWSQGVFGASRFPIEDLAAQLQCSDFAVLLATADDTVMSRGKRGVAPRDNMVFELGLFMGALTRHRTFLVIPRGSNIKIPSDLLGINAILYDPTAVTRKASMHSVAQEIVAIIGKGGPR